MTTFFPGASGLEGLGFWDFTALFGGLPKELLPGPHKRRLERVNTRFAVRAGKVAGATLRSVEGLGFRVWDLGCRVWGLGFRVY